MPKSQPERVCVGCYGKFPQSELIRVVKTSKGEIEVEKPGSGGKVKGRGAYICANEACIKKATKSKGRKKNALSYWLRTIVSEEDFVL